jgi:Domain of unknown function (DUF4286)
MIIYNVTIKVDLDIHDDWLQWMREKHIPDVLATGFFADNKIMRLLEEDNSDGFTYAIQYRCDKISDYMRYKEEEAPRLQKEVADKYEGKFVAFRTLLKEV